MIHTKAFSTVNETEVDFFLESPCFLFVRIYPLFFCFQTIFLYQPLGGIEQSSLGCTVDSFSYCHALLYIFQCLANLVLDSSQLACRKGKEVSGAVDVYFLGIVVMVHRLLQRRMALGNRSFLTQFILMGITDQPDLQLPIFFLFQECTWSL